MCMEYMDAGYYQIESEIGLQLTKTDPSIAYPKISGQCALMFLEE